jgi:hypothetical protein
MAMRRTEAAQPVPHAADHAAPQPTPRSRKPAHRIVTTLQVAKQADRRSSARGGVDAEDRAGGSRMERREHSVVTSGRRRTLLAVLLLLLPVAPAACGTPSGGDPGGRRLRELASDAVFSARPPGAPRVVVTRTPARYREPGFDAGGWHGPAVTATFRSAAPPATVYRFYARRAQAAGWHATKSGALGLADTWTKTYPDGADATLVLSLLTHATSGPPRLYTLSGGVTPVVR